MTQPVTLAGPDTDVPGSPPPGDDAEQHRAPLLLHSLAELREIVLPCLEAAGARTVVEVGAEEGTFTRHLVPWVEQRGGRLYCVEPAPPPALVELCESSDAAELVREPSPEALERVEPADAYLLDGDHNYRTVLGELEVIEARSREGGTPVVLLQDIGWPWGRRDLYYAPERLPAEAVHPYSYEKGVRPGWATAVDGGFRGEGQFAVALEEGGPRNGVLTAVEDFLEDRPGLALAKVPCVFGLGVLYARSAPHAEALAAVLRPYEDNPLLDRLEHNRLDLYVKVLEFQDLVADLRWQLEASQMKVRDVVTENRALLARNAELEQQLAVLGHEVGMLFRSRAFQAAERLSATAARVRGAESGLSRQRLQSALEGDQAS